MLKSQTNVRLNLIPTARHYCEKILSGKYDCVTIAIINLLLGQRVLSVSFHHETKTKFLNFVRHEVVFSLYMNVCIPYMGGYYSTDVTLRNVSGNTWRIAQQETHETDVQWEAWWNKTPSRRFLGINTTEILNIEKSNGRTEINIANRISYSLNLVIFDTGLLRERLILLAPYQVEWQGETSFQLKLKLFSVLSGAATKSVLKK